MTDNEIIKALECCSVSGEGDCRLCPLLKDYSPCGVTLTTNALALTHRQKAEIERLTTIMLKKEDTMQLLNQEQQNTDDELQKAKAEIES